MCTPQPRAPKCPRQGGMVFRVLRVLSIGSCIITVFLSRDAAGGSEEVSSCGRHLPTTCASNVSQLARPAPACLRVGTRDVLLIGYHHGPGRPGTHMPGIPGTQNLRHTKARNGFRTLTIGEQHVGTVSWPSVGSVGRQLGWLAVDCGDRLSGGLGCRRVGCPTEPQPTQTTNPPTRNWRSRHPPPLFPRC